MWTNQHTEMPANPAIMKKTRRRCTTSLHRAPNPTHDAAYGHTLACHARAPGRHAADSPYDQRPARLGPNSSWRLGSKCTNWKNSSQRSRARDIRTQERDFLHVCIIHRLNSGRTTAAASVLFTRFSGAAAARRSGRRGLGVRQC